MADELKFVIEPQITPCRGPLFITRSLTSADGDSNHQWGLRAGGRRADSCSLPVSTSGGSSRKNTAKTPTSGCASVSTESARLSLITMNRLIKTQHLILRPLLPLSW